MKLHALLVALITYTCAYAPCCAMEQDTLTENTIHIGDEKGIASLSTRQVPSLKYLAAAALIKTPEGLAQLSNALATNALPDEELSNFVKEVVGFEKIAVLQNIAQACEIKIGKTFYGVTTVLPEPVINSNDRYVIYRECAEGWISSRNILLYDLLSREIKMIPLPPYVGYFGTIKFSDDDAEIIFEPEFNLRGYGNRSLYTINNNNYKDREPSFSSSGSFSGSDGNRADENKIDSYRYDGSRINFKNIKGALVKELVFEKPITYVKSYNIQQICIFTEPQNEQLLTTEDACLYNHVTDKKMYLINNVVDRCIHGSKDNNIIVAEQRSSTLRLDYAINLYAMQSNGALKLLKQLTPGRFKKLAPNGSFVCLGAEEEKWRYIEFTHRYLLNNLSLPELVSLLRIESMKNKSHIAQAKQIFAQLQQSNNAIVQHLVNTRYKRLSRNGCVIQ